MSLKLSCTFNDGNISGLKVLEALGIEDVGYNTLRLLEQLDSELIARAEIAEKQIAKEARLRKRRKNLAVDEKNEGDYVPGGF